MERLYDLAVPGLRITCVDDPCVNGGTCQDLPAAPDVYLRFGCYCLQEFSGTRCEIAPPGYKFHGGSYFKFFNTATKTTDAINTCKADGGDLAQIPDQATLDFLRFQLVSTSLTNIWIGLKKENDVWIYPSTGFSNWHGNEPSGDGVCVEILVMSDYTYNDINCNNLRNFICEIQIPE
ncbi:C-type lectin lectoxin-Lio3-like isoform X2 [Tachypleus tridentatus]|uniref:C-type lectin lectoxin-Lio3-like isoform X2 n=1 Tax=Tachypleus tridentatus TaxID=6853 RepID=UPI003FD41B9E